MSKHGAPGGRGQKEKGDFTLKMGTKLTERRTCLARSNGSLVRVCGVVDSEQVKVARSFIGFNCMEDKLEEAIFVFAPCINDN